MALLFGELYRREAQWKIRAVGQGYADGLSGLVTAYGVEVGAEDDAHGLDADGASAPSDVQEPTEPTATSVAAGPDDGEDGAGRLHARDGAPWDDETGATSTHEAGEDTADRVAEELLRGGESSEEFTPEPQSRVKRGVSVRRPTRAPRFPADWEASIPAVDGNDWQPARLFPVAGIGNGEEQERRATSALLATMRMVREFGAALVAKCGGPRGTIATYIEVPFGQDEEAYRPDGVIEVTRGQRTWTALVEVKTASGRLDAEQIDHYVDIARARSFDAVITISNELLGGDAEHPVGVDRRKLRRLTLHHLSWDQIRAEALLTARHRGVADRSQAEVLEEFIRYINHARSGMTGLGDMGPNWVKVRDGVKARTARPSDKATGEVSARFDELIQHVGHYMTGILGANVRACRPEKHLTTRAVANNWPTRASSSDASASPEQWTASCSAPTCAPTRSPQPSPSLLRVARHVRSLGSPGCCGSCRSMRGTPSGSRPNRRAHTRSPPQRYSPKLARTPPACCRQTNVRSEASPSTWSNLSVPSVPQGREP